MALFEREMFDPEDSDAGIFVSHLGRALITWVAMQNRHPVTVAEAAAAWNTTPDIIRDAVEEAMWIGIEGPDDDPTKQRLELDGE